MLEVTPMISVLVDYKSRLRPFGLVLVGSSQERLNAVKDKYIYVQFSFFFQVFVDKHFVGVLDYTVQELAVPDGKVTFEPVCPSL